MWVVMNRAAGVRHDLDGIKVPIQSGKGW